MNQVRVPPHNDDAERSVLGCIMIDNTSIDDVRATIDSQDFYRESHRHIYNAMIRLHDAKQAIDVITICDTLRIDGLFEPVGGDRFVASLTNYVSSAANVLHHVGIVQQKSKARKAIANLTQAADAAYACHDVDDFIATTANDLAAIGGAQDEGNQMRGRELAKATFEYLEDATQGGDDGGISTGLVDLDSIIGSFVPTRLYILAARPAMGKTALSLNMFAHACIELGVPAAFCSLEMPNRELGARMACSEGRVDMMRLQNAMMKDEDWSRLINAMSAIGESPLVVDDTPGLALMKFKAMARRWVHRDGVKIIFIDYLQLMKDPHGRHNSRQEMVTEISTTLKALAKELNVPIVALAQLNRDLEKREDKRPKLSDLKDSGSLEQDADVVMFCTATRSTRTRQKTRELLK